MDRPSRVRTTTLGMDRQTRIVELETKLAGWSEPARSVLLGLAGLERPQVIAECSGDLGGPVSNPCRVPRTNAGCIHDRDHTHHVSWRRSWYITGVRSPVMAQPEALPASAVSDAHHWYDRMLLDVERRFEAGEIGWTGLPALDELLGPWVPPFTIGVTGAPGSGRSALLLGLVVHRASHGHAAIVVNDHLSPIVLRQRIAAGLSGVAVRHIRGGRLTDRDWAALARGRRRGAERIAIVDPAELEDVDFPPIPRDHLVALDLHGSHLELAVQRLVRDSNEASAGLLVDLGPTPDEPRLDQVDVVIRVAREPQRTPGIVAPAELVVERNRLGPTDRVDVLFRLDTLQFVGLLDESAFSQSLPCDAPAGQCIRDDAATSEPVPHLNDELPAPCER